MGLLSLIREIIPCESIFDGETDKDFLHRCWLKKDLFGNLTHEESRVLTNVRLFFFKK